MGCGGHPEIICGAYGYSQDVSEASARRWPTFQANTLRGPTTCFQSAQPWLPMIMGQSEGWPGFWGGDCKRHELWQLPAARCSCLPVSGSHWCSQGSRSRQAQRSMAQGPLEFCWREKRTTWEQFSQSLASSWLPSSKMKRLPAGRRESDMCLCVHITPTTHPSTYTHMHHRRQNKGCSAD